MAKYTDKYKKFIVEEIYHKAIRLRYCSKMTEEKDLDEEKRKRLVQEEHDILILLGNQFDICENHFMRYLEIPV